MADSKPINWAYPFKSAGEASKEVSDPQLYFDALAKAKDGFYPMGANGLWHGGVHFDAGTAALLDQSEVRCIADGEVIAYRIDDKYPETPYAATNQPGIGPEPLGAKYSTGFVLVKHRLELPPAPPPATLAGETSATTTETVSASATSPAQTLDATETTPAANASEALTFYSLYMHLLDWTGYQSQSTLKRPAFWGAGLYKVKADAPDKVLGLNVREHHKVGATDENYAKYQNKLTTLPRGTTIETGEAAPSPDQNWRKLVRATPAVAGLAENTGWVYVQEAKKLTENRYLVSEKDSTDAPALEQIGLHVREAANGSSNVLAVLPRGTEIKVSQESTSGKYLKLESIISGNAVPPLTADAEGKLPGYVWLDSLESQQTPNVLAKDKVYALPQGHSIKAGELIGHQGVYQEYNQQAPEPRLHLEVFSSEDVPAFIEKSKARAETLPDTQKTLIKVDEGSKIIQPATADGQIETGADVRICSDSPKAGRWAKVQKYVTSNAQKNTELGSFAADFTYPLSAAQKTTLAARMGIEAADMPDKVDFLKVSFSSVEGGDPLPYVQGTSVPQTHLWRKIGAAVGEPIWVERAKLNAQGQRTSTTGALAAWSEFPLHSRIEGQACGYARILPAGSWDGLPDERKAIDPDNVNWWYVTVGDKNGNDISGWAAEKDLIVSRHSPWEWPGFSTIQDKLPLDAHLARTLDAAGRVTEEEAQSYAALIEEAERGEILGALYKVIDLPNEQGERDNKLTPAEFQTALGKPWLAQQLSLLISQHESEWFSNEAKWNQLDKLMDHTPADPNPDWVAEKQRIETLSWWKELAGQPGIAADGVAWHFQPVGMIGTFLQESKFKITTEMLAKVFKSANKDKLSALVNELNPRLTEYKLDTPLRLSHFFAQVRVEVGDDYALVESLRYRPSKLLDFSYFSSRPEEAELYGYKPGIQDANQVEIANRAYNGVTGNTQLGNGDIASGDGWKYRGRGLKQLTGRYNYTEFNKNYPELWPAENIDFATNPEKLEEPIYAARSAVYFWLKNRLYEIADQGSENEKINSITAIINKHTDSYGERRNQFKRIWVDEKIFN